MTEEKYISSIVRHIKCRRGLRNEIWRQLHLEIDEKLEHGQKLETVIAKMGDPKEVAAQFNETLSDDEKKIYKRNQVLRIVIPVVCVILIIAVYIMRRTPTGIDISESEYFDGDTVEAAVLEVIDLLDAGDYTALRDMAMTEMQEYLDADTIESGKENIAEDWGERQETGSVGMSEVTKNGVHYAVGEVDVTYENISVTYSITFDEDMNLAGLYIR